MVKKEPFYWQKKDTSEDSLFNMCLETDNVKKLIEIKYYQKNIRKK